MSAQEIIVVNSQPALLTANFAEVEKKLAKELEKYNVVVTSDTVADAKKLAKDLNATKKVIDDKRKDEVAKASEPIKKFDENMKKLVAMCGDEREKLLKQVKKFEEETLKLVECTLTKCRTYLFEQHGVTKEFERAEFDDLIKHSALTAKGKLTKSVKDELQRRVLADKAIQDQTERRLLELENISLKSGLSAPLTRDHVIGFLFEGDERYQSEVNRIIAVEIERQEQAETALRKKLAKEKEVEQAVSPAPEPKAKPVQEQPKTSPVKTTPAPKGKIKYEVTCSFIVDVPAGVTESAINTELRSVMQKAGLSTLSSVYVKPLQQKNVA